jgi:phage shock protein A
VWLHPRVLSTNREPTLQTHARYLACISLDKSTYRHGETVRGRAIIIDAATKVPSTEQISLEFVVSSSRGTKVFSLQDAGTSSLSFAWKIPSTQAGGEYNVSIRERSGAVVAVERKFSIRHYRAPRLRTELEFLKKAYGPNDEVVASCQATRAEGGIPEGAAVSVSATLCGAPILSQKLTLDATGSCVVRFTLPADLKEGDATLSLSIMDDGVQESIAKSIPLLVENLSMHFYPESGDLIRGIENRVYFEAKAPNGKPADVSGRIIHNDQTLAHFSTEHEGRGSVMLLVPEGFAGHAVIDSPAGISTIFSIEPPVSWEKKGILVNRERFASISSCHDVYEEGAPVLLKISSKKIAALKIRLSSRAGDLASEEVVFDSAGTKEVSLPTTKGVFGVIRATLFSGETPLAERLVFLRPTQKIRASITLSHSKTTPRGAIEVKLKTSHEDGSPVSALVGLSVVDDAVLSLIEKRERPPRLPEQVLLEPEVESLFDATSYASNARHLDLLLGTQGWRRFAFYLREAFVSSQAPLLFAKTPDPLIAPIQITPASPESPEAPERRGGIFSRLGGLIRSNVYDALHKQSDAEVMLNQVILEMYTQLVEAKKVVAVAIADEKRLAKQLEAAVLLSKEWEKKAMMAVRAEDEILARQALARRTEHYQAAINYQTQHQTQKDATEKLKNALRGLQNKIDEARRKKDLLIARQKRAEAQQSIQSTLTGMTDTSAFETFDRMAQKVDQFEAEAEAQSDLSLDFSGGMLEDKFALLEAGAGSVAYSLLRGRKGLDLEIGEFPSPEEMDPLRILKIKMGLIQGELPVSRAAENIFVVEREYAHRTTPAEDGARHHFIETLYFHSGLQTNILGEATFSFDVSDSITTYRVMVDAIDNAGALTTEDATIEVQKPFYMEAKLPFAVSAGDQCRIPVVMVNETEGTLSPSVSVALSGALNASEALSVATLAAKSRSRALIPISIGATPGKTKVSVDAKADGISDQVVREFSIEPLGFPRAIKSSGILDREILFPFRIPDDAMPGTITAELRLYQSLADTFQSSIVSMLREPHGCFEQASATTYPNIMILRYLSTDQNLSPEVTRTALDLIEKGYQKLTSYECKGGGFEWFGRSPAHETLSAFGLMEFVDMSRVYPVDPKMLARTKQWLLSRRNGDGGFQQERGKYAFSSTPVEVADAYITWALSYAGEKGLERELKASRDRALQSNDPYLIAVTANALRCAGEDSDDLLALLASKQAPNGSFPGARSSITSSYGNSLLNETTAIAAIALLHGAQYQPEALRAVQFIQTSNDRGQFGSTQATVLCLQALSLLPAVEPSTEPPMITVSLDEDSRECAAKNAIELPSFGPGEHLLTLRASQPLRRAYSLWIGYQTQSPESTPGCKISLATALSQSQVQEGATVDLSVVVSNETTEALPMIVAVLGLPGGVEPRYEHLKELVAKGEIDFFEVTERLVVLYWRGMLPSEEKRLRVSLLASIPGVYSGPASRAYLYYSNEWKSWAQPVSIEISPLE